VPYEVYRREAKKVWSEQPLDFREGDQTGRGTVIATQHRILILPEGSTEPIAFLITTIKQITVSRQLIGGWENFCVMGFYSIERGTSVIFKFGLEEDNEEFVKKINRLRLGNKN